MNKTIGFLGCGNMGGAIARAVCKAVDPKDVWLANRTAAKDRHILTAVVIILEYTVDSYGCRLKHGSLLIWNIVCEWYCILLRNHYIICVCSLFSGTDEAVMLAERKITLLAVVTFHTGKKWRTGYTVTDLHLGNAFSHFHYITGKFMSQHDGIKMYAVI